MMLLLAFFWIAGCPASQAAALTASESALLYASYAAEGKKDFDAAIAKMTTLLNSEPDDYLVNYRLGWLFSCDQKYKNAIEHYTRAAQVAPESVEPWLALSLLQLDLGNDKAAIDASEQALKRDPKNYYGLLRLAAARQALKSYAAALDVADHALKLYPLDTQFLEKKGWLLKQLGKGSESRQTLEFLLLIDPQNAYARSELKR